MNCIVVLEKEEPKEIHMILLSYFSLRKGGKVKKIGNGVVGGSCCSGLTKREVSEGHDSIVYHGIGEDIIVHSLMGPWK